MPFRTLLSALTLVSLAVGGSAGDLRGRVLVDDKPAAGITVSALPFEDGFAAARREARREGLPKALAEATARGDGTFLLTVPGPAGTTLRLGFSGRPVVPTVLEALFDSGGEDVGDVRLQRAAALAGRLVDARGGPVVGAMVTLWAGGSPVGDRSPGGAPPQTTMSKADGTFRFEAAGEAGNRIRVEAPGFAAAERSGLRSGAVLRPVALALGGARQGRVTLPDRRTPAAGALVRFEGRTVTTRWTEARADGTFLVDGLPREAGSLAADAGEQGRAVSPVAAEASEPVTLVLALTASLAGRVVDARRGKPLRGVRLVVRGEGTSFLGRSDAEGRYRFRGLSPRRYRLAADDDRFVPWTREVLVAAGESAAQDVPLVLGATLMGRVVSEEGVPIEGAVIQVIRPGENPFRAFVRGLSGEVPVRSGRDGAFRARRLAPGDNQRLEVRHEDFENRTVAGISLTPGGTRTGLTVVLRRGLIVRGFVKDGDEHPLAGAEITLTRARTFRRSRGGVQLSLIGPGTQVRHETGADGSFEFRGLSSGEYTVAARRTGFSSATVDPVSVAEGRETEPLQLVLKPGVTITGVVRDRSGDGAPGWFVSARPAGEGGGGPTFGPGSLRTEQPTGTDGVFLLEGLAAGETYDLQVMGPSGLGPRKAGVVAPADDVEMTVAGTGQIQGRVVDAERGSPLTDFEVRYQPDAQGGMRFVMRMGGGRGRGAYERQPFHADDGSYVLEEVPPGRWTVEAFAEGYQAGSASGVEVGESQAVEGVDIRLSKGGVITGHVLDSSGRPILDANVRAELSGGDPRMRGVRVGIGGGIEEDSDSGTTDADGRYEIAGLAPGTWTVTASHPDWSEATASVELKDAPATADIRLGRGGTVAGVVTAGGRPVGGAQVDLSASGDAGMRGGMFGGGDQSSMSDDGGRFRFERLNPGRYSVVASLRDQTSAPVDVVVTGDDAQEVQVTLAEGASIRGVVSGLPEAQLAGVNVSAQGRDFIASTRTGAGGTFEVNGAPEGTVTLRATAGDFLTRTRTASAVVTIGPGQVEAQAEIVFEQGFRVEGRVTRGGQPVPDAMVSAFSEGARGRSASGRTDESGGYVLEGLDEGSYVFMASPANGGPIRKTVSITGDTTVDLEAPPARIGGTVLEAGTGRPLGDVAVRIEDETEGRRFMTMATSDSSGRFAFEGLEPRAYRVSFQKPSYEVETRQITAAEDTDEHVELRRGEGLAVEARDGILATPLRGLFVRIVDGAGGAAFAGSVPLDSGGHGEVPSLKPGVYELHAESSGYAPVTIPAVTVPSTTLSLVMTPGGSLEIQAGPETLALPRPTARLLGADGRVYMPSAFSSDGKIGIPGPVRRIENVVPGRYVLEVEGGVRRDVTITEGGATVVSLP